MARRSFSLMLAWRYLNPRRAMLSAVTIISVTGVTLAVWILIVVMSVYNGMAREVQKRLLGYTPHVRLEYVPFGDMREPISDWRGIAEEVSRKPGVQAATAFVQDYVMLDVEGRQRPGFFRGVDTQDPAQVAGIDQLLDKAKYPEASADMGLDDRVVVSSQIVKQLGIRIGDKISLYSARNFPEVKRAYEITNGPPARELIKEPLEAARKILAAPLEKRGDQVFLSNEIYQQLYSHVYDAVQDLSGKLRPREEKLLTDYFGVWDEADETDGGFLVAAGAPARAATALEDLAAADLAEMDAETLKGIKQLVLPKEAQVIGIYQVSQMALMPDIFMPLPLAQELSGLEGSVQGISIRLDDAYQAEVFARSLLKDLPADWQAVTWFTEFGEFSRILNQQRIMMYIVLSMIMVISAFSMMAVVFTVTIQKRREIGVMKALGAASSQIVRVFVYQGVILGISGAILGVGFAFLTLAVRGGLQNLLRRLFNFDPFPADFNGFHELPSHVNPVEVVGIAVAGFLLCSLAAFVPAFFAARSDAAKSLRNL